MGEYTSLGLYGIFAYIICCISMVKSYVFYEFYGINVDIFSFEMLIGILLMEIYTFYIYRTYWKKHSFVKMTIFNIIFIGFVWALGTLCKTNPFTFS